MAQLAWAGLKKEQESLWKCRFQIPLEALINSQKLPICFDYEVINHFIAFSFGGPLRKNGSLFPSTPQLFFFSLLLYARLKPSAHLQLCLLSPYFLLPVISRTAFTCFHLESVSRQSRSVQTSA